MYKLPPFYPELTTFNTHTSVRGGGGVVVCYDFPVPCLTPPCSYAQRIWPTWSHGA